MLLTFRSTFSVGISTLWFTASRPCSTVPVSTVPWPLIAKQWSTANSSGFVSSGAPAATGGGTRRVSSAVSAARPSAPPAPSGPPGRAATGTMAHPANLVAANVAASRFRIFSTWAARVAAGRRSTWSRGAAVAAVWVSSPTTQLVTKSRPRSQGSPHAVGEGLSPC